MTLSTTLLVKSYSGNDVTTEFAVPFKFTDETHLIVTLIDSGGTETVQTLTTHYTTTGAGDPSGTVTMVTAPATGETLFIRRTVPLTQLVDYISGDSFPAETHEGALDLLTMAIQQLSETNDRSLRLSETTEGVDAELPSPTANKALMWNATADAIKNSDSDFDTLVADTTAAGAAQVALAITEASNAATSASNALTSETNAAASEAAAAASYDDFDDRYLGPKASDPTLDNDGDGLLTGALYFNSTTNAMKVYDGAAWQEIDGATSINSYDVIIAYGQSNAVGFAGQPAVPAIDDYATPAPNPASKAYDPATNAIVAISNTMNHLNYVDEGTASRGNAWTAFANKWVEETGRGCVIVNAARGGKSVAELSKGAGTGSTDYYQVLLDGYASTKAAMVTASLTLGDTYLVYHQGETDMTLGTDFETYKEALKTLFTDLITDIAELSKIGVYIVGCPESRNQFDWHRIQSGQYAAAEQNEGVSVIYDGCVSFDELSGQYNPLDLTHYSQRGYNQMGEGGARGLAQWVKSGINIISSEEQKESKMRIKGAGYVMTQYVAARASHSASAWSLLRRNNTVNDDSYYPCYVDGVLGEVSDGIAADEIRFRFSGIAPVFYDYSVTISQELEERGIRAVASRYVSGSEYGISVKFFADISFLANVDSGAILGAYPPAVDTFTSSVVSGSVTATNECTLTHPAIKQSPTVAYYAATSMATAEVSLRANLATETRVFTAGANNQVIVSMKDVPLTRAMLENIGDFEVGISAMVSIYHSEQAGASLP